MTQEVLSSGITLVSSNFFPLSDTVLTNFIYTDDSVRISKEHWGLFDLVTVRAGYKQDTLRKALLLGKELSDSMVMYIADEDRNISVSGETKIIGQAFIPQAGIKPAFVDGNFYKGLEKIVDGKISYSNRELPTVSTERLEAIYQSLSDLDNSSANLSSIVQQSFFEDRFLMYQSAPILLSDRNLKGKIIIQSDSAITISSNCNIQNIICIAPYVKIEDNFSGSLQAFAKDSISIGKNCVLNYPSALVLNPTKAEQANALKIGDRTKIAGTILLYENERSIVPHLVELGENLEIEGDLIAFGLLKYKSPLYVSGSTYCYRFVTQTVTTMYENYLIDVTFDRLALNPFIVRSAIWQETQLNTPNRIVTWLN